MFERFLERLSKSEYKDKFIIKGGLLLSSIMGLDMRTTMDIDTIITGMNFELSQIRKIIEEIISIELNDNVMFEISNLSPIKEDNDYGGYKFKLIATQNNVKVRFSIDVFTGDIITPRAIEYKHKMISEYRSSYKINNIEISPNIINGKVEYFKISSKIKF